MLRKRNEYKSLITPAGEAIFPAINEPDYKFKEEGEYHARLRFKAGDPALEPLLTLAQQILDEAFDAKVKELTDQKKAGLVKQLNKADIIKEEIDDETGEPTGNVILRAKLRARVDIKKGPKAGTSFDKKPDVFDARRKQLVNPPKVGSGSVLKLSVTPIDYFMPKEKTVGVSFELGGVQILKLVTGGQRDAGSYGFGEEEGDSIDDVAADSGFDNEAGGYAGTDEDTGSSGRDF